MFWRIIHRDDKSQQCQSFQWWERMLSLNTNDMENNSCSNKVLCHKKNRVNKCRKKEKLGFVILQLSQSRLNDLMSVWFFYFFLVCQSSQEEFENDLWSVFHYLEPRWGSGQLHVFLSCCTKWMLQSDSLSPLEVNRDLMRWYGLRLAG